MENMHYPMEELMPIVSKLAWKYTGCDHTSVTYEKAQMLMEAVLYCIREYEQSEENALLVNKIPAKEAYELGRQLVMDKLRRLQQLYNEMITDFKAYGSVCLRDTICKGIPVFLEKYDYRYAPQETLLTLDYPVLSDLSALMGVNRVFAYVQYIDLEQKFLQKMEEGYILEVLRRYHRDYEYLMENICEIILQNMIGHLMLDKPLQETGLSEEEIESLKGILADMTTEQIKAYALKALEQLMAQYYDNDKDMFSYLQCGIDNAAAYFLRKG